MRDRGRRRAGSLSRRLQDQYLLPPAEADKAVAEFLDSRTPPLPELTDESYLEAATFVAASLWTGMTDPRVVAVNEQLRRVTGMEEAITAAETDWDISEPATPEQCWTPTGTWKPRGAS